jgi:hypothetical protein
MNMTQHLLQEHEIEDRTAMRRLVAVIGCFAIATAILAIAVGMVMG